MAKSYVVFTEQELKNELKKLNAECKSYEVNQVKYYDGYDDGLTYDCYEITIYD